MIKKGLITVAALSLLISTPVMAAAPEQENVYMTGPTSVVSARAFADSEGISTFANGSTTYHSSVSPSYGLISGCTLSGTAWCTTPTNTKTVASFSAISSFYRSNGGTLTGAAKIGSSSSSKDFTWSASDDSSGQYYTSSTSTSTSCSKTGYTSKILINTTSNPYQ